MEAGAVEMVAVIVAILFAPSVTLAFKQVRDGSGNLIREESGDND
jgi:hypothetical protein